MADEKISQLDAVTDVLDDDDYVLARAGASKRITGASLKADLGGPGGGFGNWCKITFANIPDLTVADPLYEFAEADLTITDQEGSDYSLGSNVHGGTVQSAAGGIFQCGAFFTSIPATLDAGSTRLRSVSFAAVTGEDDRVVNPWWFGGGYDVSQIVNIGTQAAVCTASNPGKCLAGGTALCDLSVVLANGFGTDTVAGSDITNWLNGVLLWQVG